MRTKHEGRKFGKLTVLGIDSCYTTAGGAYVQMAKCRCDCGAIRVAALNCVRRGDAYACRACTLASNGQTAHHPLKPIWRHMINRCHDPKSTGYEHYGARGIEVCDRWRNSFEDFLTDMGERPGPGYSIDRQLNNGHYEPGNCRWATIVEQNNNTRHNVNLTVYDRTMTLAQWARELNLKSPHTLYIPRQYGLTVEQGIAYRMKLGKPKYVNWRDVETVLSCGIPFDVILEYAAPPG